MKFGGDRLRLSGKRADFRRSSENFTQRNFCRDLIVIIGTGSIYTVQLNRIIKAELKRIRMFKPHLFIDDFIRHFQMLGAHRNGHAVFPDLPRIESRDVRF